MSTTDLAGYDDWLRATAAGLRTPPLIGPNAEDMDDLAQHGRIAMWRALDTHRPARGALPAWLTLRAFGVMRNRLRPALKNQVYGMTFIPGHDDPVYQPNYDGAALSAAHGHEFKAALESLTPQQREYVELRFWHGYTYRELTEHFGYEPGGIWRGARKKLRHHLAHLEANDE